MAERIFTVEKPLVGMIHLLPLAGSVRYRQAGPKPIVDAALRDLYALESGGVDAVVAKIHEVFRFMFRSNLRRRGRLSRATRLFAFDLSRKLDAMSPTLERALFTGPTKLWELVKGVRELAP